MVRGNTQGIKRHILNMLENIYETKCYDFISQDILDLMAKVTCEYNREVLVAISRQGNVVSVAIGSYDAASIAVDSQRKGLNGIRLIHTHPDGNSMLSQADISALQRNKFDSVAAVGVDSQGNITGYYLGYLTANGVKIIQTQDIFDPQYLDLIKECDKEIKGQKSNNFFEIAPQKERAILACIASSDEEADINLRELKSLAESAGAETVAVFKQKKNRPDPKFLFGKGKIEEMKIAVQNHDADTLIVDNELSAIMTKNLENELNVKVIDRSTLILDIFASRAQSMEGKLQVELAQLKYSLPKLLNTGEKMDRLRQGIGMRGPGEKKLETDRRRIKDRVKELEEKLEKLEKERDLRRSRRAKSFIPTVALVGYTNAGKSTLMNLLSGADVLAENKLFATLDPVTRKVYTPSGYYTLTDTVGFIRKLPHEFIEAFKSTLEEAVQADLILHVMDYSDANLFLQYEAVLDVLEKIGAAHKPMINVYNKIDIASGERLDLPTTKDSVFISALTGQGVDKLKERIAEKIFLTTEANR